MKTMHKEGKHAAKKQVGPTKGHKTGNEELEQPEKHEFERGSIPDKEFDYKEQNEVEQSDTPEAPPEHERDVTLTDLDPTFIGIDHHRKTGRMVGHEPGPENNL